MIAVMFGSSPEVRWKRSVSSHVFPAPATPPVFPPPPFRPKHQVNGQPLVRMPSPPLKRNQVSSASHTGQSLAGKSSPKRQPLVPIKTQSASTAQPFPSYSSSPQIVHRTMHSASTSSVSSMVDASKLEQMKIHLEKLERGLGEVCAQLEVQKAEGLRDKRRVKELEAECMQINACKSNRSVASQTDSLPVFPIYIPLKPHNTPVQDSLVEKLTNRARHEFPAESVVLRFEEPAFEKPLRQALSGQSGQSSQSGKSVSHRAKELLETLESDEEFLQILNQSFDKLDGAQSGCLSRDLCLALASMVLKERGIQSCVIPKVICSRMLRSLASNLSRFDDNHRASVALSAASLRKDLAPDFLRLVLEFIIEEDRSV